jgi:zinc transport system substrate-binding protein
MNRLLPSIALCLLTWTCVASAAASPPPVVVASITPVHSLVAAVMENVGSPTLLLPSGASPHTASLRPSDAAVLQRADVVFWVGEAMETFLAKPLAVLAARARIVALADSPGMVLLPPRGGGAWDRHDHDESVGDGGERHSTDMHIWLDPVNAIVMADAIASALTEVDPAHAGAYAANVAALRRRLQALDEDLRAELRPVAGKPYVVFHDAYHYLEARYGLSPVGAITISPDRAPGARTLADIRNRIASSGALCVFREPQFEPALVGTAVAGTPARVAVLDPLGADLAPGPDAYFTLMRRLAGSLSTCLGE